MMTPSIPTFEDKIAVHTPHKDSVGIEHEWTSKAARVVVASPATSPIPLCRPV
jgi:hypothetical protein